MRKLSLVLSFAVVASVLLIAPSIALANFGVHGGYSMDTDACAGCHRAHTAASSITWTNRDGDRRNALLLSTATELYQFCFTCHGGAAAGADTNVVDGVYEGTAFGTTGMGLNSGAFGDHVVGRNKHTYVGGTWGAWGGGATGREGIISTGYGNQIVMTCGSCHDVHGSSNYRLLKDVVNGVTVGGYTEPTPGNYVPNPYVISNEVNYPGSGWLLHDPGAVQMGLYQPNYTSPMYAKAPGNDPTRGISAWCAACHTQYHRPDLATSSVYDANDGFGYVTRHRHPVNVELGNYKGPRSLIVTDQPLPLAQEFGDWTPQGSATDWIDCLTCHRAHGSDAEMTGYANVWDSTDPEPDTGVGAVDPGTKNAFLRMDNRGVCQSCHNK